MVVLIYEHKNMSSALLISSVTHMKSLCLSLLVVFGDVVHMEKQCNGVRRGSSSV